MGKFKISAKFKPDGDQPKAIKELTAGLKQGNKFQTLLGVTGSGKTFTMANVIENIQKPTLVIAPNKTLAAQLAQEFRTFFPKNAVEYFVSYYDYYQPEAYIAASDTYIEKESQINDEIDRLRHAATMAVMSRKDVVIVASVSCIYGLGSPEFYEDISLSLKMGEAIDREKLISDLAEMHFLRSEYLSRGRFRAHGDTIEIMSPSREIVTRIELKEDKIGKISEYDFLTGEALGNLEKVLIYPAKHFVVPEPVMEEALSEIEKELNERVAYFKKHKKLLEAERIYRRTKQDLEMMREIGYCNGIENYSRYLTGRKAGEPPYTLVDYFSKDFLIVIDESHVTVPQLNAMYNGDHARKKTLIDNGFRLPSAYDNRPLKFSEFEEKINQVIFTSATPGKYELAKNLETKFPSGNLVSKKSGVVEQIIRPTGLIDPELVIKSAKGQVKDVIAEITKVVDKKERVLVTTLTKKMAEDLAEFLKENEIKSEYLHSGVDTMDRVRILENLRRGKFDVLVGVNLLREGLDLPEVSLVAILDADKEGFLRSETSLVQTIGRAARNISGRVILYADHVTGSMKRAIDETNRRRATQTKYNKKHRITPKTIKKKIESIVDHELKPEIPREFVKLESLEDIAGYIKQKEAEMKTAARNMEFEKAAVIRDEIIQLRKLQMG
ncbi:MAG: excinuclease ABC subunit B, excinuclease ABC subunit B [Candidatus Moranbacteria bacterium GW2011_GWC1_45_18]|nr:MAG: UvrABC system protein B [Candidatus Moranbacteria bacterium GW2011_GWC2_40_12]KKT99311.1 MAG: excinuclease ABC subunit B, excinuclease ABC subunit B [Candidatus Moranbacteria bacterium GW2011_GWC1_45_18]OGI36735.1 MAG: excinuclease ABC subunit B [Candidatus Moranbacteria bacterium RIFOXYC1_FULL_44_8]OGI40670.1 MAG: excinuclease ABC subunit B [Candidatus Moranbacteria bacterium RIFOXYB1_FULL_44_23]HBB36404.1 excinuclease ABC subunit B [Candidatus Moranbacteria bacterium]